MKKNLFAYFILALVINFDFVPQPCQSKTNNESFSPSALLGSIDSSKSTDQLFQALKLLKIINPQIKDSRLIINGTIKDIKEAGFSANYYNYAVEYATLYNLYTNKLRPLGHALTPPYPSSKHPGPEEIIAAAFVGFSPDNGMPELLLSKDEARKIGLSDEMYENILRSLEQTKNAIIKSVNEGAVYDFHNRKSIAPISTALGIIIAGPCPITTGAADSS